MTNFALKPIDFPESVKQTFHELVVNPTGNLEKDKNKGQLTEFEISLESRYKSELKTIITYMVSISHHTCPPVSVHS